MTKPLQTHRQIEDAIRLTLNNSGCTDCHVAPIRKATDAEQKAHGRNWMLQTAGYSVTCSPACIDTMEHAVDELTKYDVAWPA